MIYFDNSATSYPKPLCVKTAYAKAFAAYSFNSGRGGYRASLKAAGKIYEVREKLGKMFSCNAENIAFTKNCTEALNYAIKGSLRKDCHIIISSLEHNSVSRVAEKLKNDGICDYSIVPYNRDLNKTVASFKKAVRENTTVIICTFASNVFGVMMPIKEIGSFCRERGIRFIVDAAQGAGLYPINMKDSCIDILCAPGHKSIMAPMGTGFIALNDGVKLNTVIEGGTGSKSLSLVQPESYPDRLESGTLNNSGIIAMGAAVDYIMRCGMEALYEAELGLVKYMYSALSDINAIKLYTDYPEESRSMPVLSFNCKNYSSEKTARMLSEYNICTRAGYHCAPLAHRHFNTIDRGTVRLSPGCFNTKKECDRFINVVKKL